jgi:hypothetical protein
MARFTLRLSNNVFFRIPSSLHALVVGIVSIKLVWIDWTFDHDPIDAYHPLIDRVVAFSFGYEIYDMLVMYMQTGAASVMYIHHLVLCLCYLLSVVSICFFQMNFKLYTFSKRIYSN